MLGRSVDASLDCSASQNMIFSSRTAEIKKRVEPGMTEFMMHAMALPNATQFARSAKCHIKEVSEARESRDS